MPIDEAQQNVERGVVELVYPDGQHGANGLLVTANGYFLTAYHCVDRAELRKNFRVKTYAGELFPISRVCAYDSSLDLALVKAKIPEKPQSLTYKFFKADQFSPFHREPVVALARRNGNIAYHGGYTKGQFVHALKYLDEHSYERLAICDMATTLGDSGGVVVTRNGDVVGILSGGGVTDVSSIASWYEALAMMVRYAHSF